ncbi:MAG: WecB/TagA/CpsF family glycosyltransferase, partial [Parcubacteria group bacterium]
GALILGEKLKNRVTGATLTREILDNYNQEGIRVYIVRRSDSLSTTEDIDKLFQQKYPKVKVKVGDWGEINKINEICLNEGKEEKNSALINDINSFAPQFLFVTIGAPKQELWLVDSIRKMPSVRVALAVGGSFDFLTGKMKRAPKVMRDTGFEWLFRFYLEPKRLMRIKNALADFMLKCHVWRVRMATTMRTNVVAIIRNKDGKILIQKNKRIDQWQFAQGGINKNEKPETAAVREAGEELGLSPHLLKVIKVLPERHDYVWPRYAQLLRGYKGQSQVACLIEFSGNDSDFHFENSDEVKAIEWVSKSELIARLHPARRELARLIIDHL